MCLNDNKCCVIKKKLQWNYNKLQVIHKSNAGLGVSPTQEASPPQVFSQELKEDFSQPTIMPNIFFFSVHLKKEKKAWRGKNTAHSLSNLWLNVTPMIIYIKNITTIGALMTDRKRKRD